ncbi:DHHC palmitoyltransferase-domain-containing protein [Massariosphaeria phaeospora]|uniref:Palmitoyltransferase n=1 Tax=Massariosphaeria phaeospora TaxID=100035 RepID=A0A7C8M6V4_9PLEO|nr:DHHC palmitoyltransferase-domain-containing protein [Massariosphaeria phaeospora]
MAFARNIAIFTITISLVTFIAFFGSLPALRNTPVGFLHRLLVIHIPSSLRKLDLKLTNGRITDGSARLGHYLMYDKHPVVVVFFLGLVTASAALFLPVIWEPLPMLHRFLILLVLPQPYLFTYLCARWTPTTFITDLSHPSHMRLYPYDRILYYPGNTCSTCKWLKPARSKHCSICKTCVSRADHHCIWVNNCLGRGNYKWFLALLLSTTILLAYGAYLAYIVISPLATEHYIKYERWYKYKTDPAANSSAWLTYLNMKLHFFVTYSSIYLEVGGLRASGVGLLALLTWPLPLGLLSYHIYLIWAGMTTNETSKWADWRDDMAEGVVFLGQRREDAISELSSIRASDPMSSSSSTSSSPISTPPETPPKNIEEPPTSWPLQSRHILIRTQTGQPPRNLPSRIRSVANENSFERVWSLAAVENVYDLGFWDNFLEALE